MIAGRWARAARQESREPAAGDDRGMSIIELVLVIVIVATVSAIAIPSYLNARDRARNVKAIADISLLQRDIALYTLERNAQPTSLNQIGRYVLDPWGNAYQYLSFVGLKGKGSMRKDKFLVPINSSYDLYSMGADGKTTTALTAKVSRDDIIRANDGSFIGLAVDF